MKRWIGWAGRAFSYALFVSPHGLRRAFAWVLAFLWFDLFRIRRQSALDNVAIAFPQMAADERVRIVRQSLQHLAHNLVEYSFLPWVTKDNANELMEFQNFELLDEVLARGRGALLLTLHMGHGDLACAAMSFKGYPVIMVSKVFKAKWLNDLWFGMRERAGTKFVPPRNSSYALLKGLKTGHCTIIPLDQFTGPPVGVRTTFFGRETGTAAGLAVMAARSKAPVISCYTWRQANGRHALRMVREIPLGGDSADSTEDVTQRFNNELETFVRLHPEQWMWIHRRWKTFKY